MWTDFKEFVLRGNVLDLAVGVIIGAAFNKIVTSLVDDLLLPPLGMVTGGVDFSNLYISLRGAYPSLAAARAAGAPVIAYGVFLNTLLQFLIMAFCVFLIIRAFNRLRRRPAEQAAQTTTRNCPYCLSVIPLEASRCAHCTSELQPAEVRPA